MIVRESGICGAIRQNLGLDKVDTSNGCDYWIRCFQGRDIGIVVIPVLPSDGTGRILVSSTVAVGSNRNLSGLLANYRGSGLA